MCNTFGVTPNTLGHDDETRKDTLVYMVDGYMENSGSYLNMYVSNKETLIELQKHPEEYPTLTV